MTRRRPIVVGLVMAFALVGSGPLATAATTTTRAVHPSPVLQLGSTGAAVRVLQNRLSVLGYWLGQPTGIFGDSTQQAVYALQKAAGLRPDGVVGPLTLSALTRHVKPALRAIRGNAVEVNLTTDLLLIVLHGVLVTTLNTSTGGGYTYSVDGQTSVALTPTGLFHVQRQANGLVVDSLGALWRPNYFDGGFAIHGDSYVPPFPVSHGCVRVSDEAIDWIWARGYLSPGTAVWIYR